MKYIYIITLVLLCAAFAHVRSSAQGINDVIVMKNGDRFTCEIKGLEEGVLSVSLAYVDGTVAIQWSKVARVESERLFIVKTSEGAVYEGQIKTTDLAADQPVKIEVKDLSDKQTVLDTAAVVAINTSSESVWRRFSGDINFGMSYSKGSQATQYSVGSTIEYPRDRWGVKASFNSQLSSSDGSETSARHELSAIARRRFSRTKFFYAGLVDILHSSEQGIDLQTGLAGGIGYYIRDSNRTKFSVVGGIGWQRTNYSGSGTSDDTQRAIAGIVIAELKVFKFKKTKFNIDATFAPSITEPGRMNLKLNQSYYVKLFKDLSWNISFYGNWDNRPPGGLSGSDYGTSTGLGWTFGNK